MLAVKTSIEHEPIKQEGNETEWSALVQKYPELRTVALEIIDPSEMEDAACTGGMLELDPERPAVRVCLVDSDLEHYKQLLKRRSAGIALIAAQLGVAVTEISPEILQRFILWHEAGHARNFVRDYLQLPQIGGDYWLAYAAYMEASDRALGDLPIPYWYPSELAAAIAEEGEGAFMAAHPKIAAFAREHGLDVPGLLAAQEQAYKQTYHEQAADRFARENMALAA